MCALEYASVMNATRMHGAQVEIDTYPSVVSAGRDLLTGCVKSTRLSHLEEKLNIDERRKVGVCGGGGGKND